MIIKALVPVELTESEVISEGAVGYCSEVWSGPGGSDGGYRIALCRKFVSGLPPGALAVYEIAPEELGRRFQEVKDADLNVCERRSLIGLKEQLDATF